MCNEDIEWNDGYWIEGFDRINTIGDMVDILLDEHPAIVKAGLQSRVDAISEMIQDMYQAMGNIVDEEDLGDEVQKAH